MPRRCQGDSRKAAGFVFLALVIVIWVGQGELAQYIQVGW